jgi:hypothetical protein
MICAERRAPQRRLGTGQTRRKLDALPLDSLVAMTGLPGVGPKLTESVGGAPPAGVLEVLCEHGSVRRAPLAVEDVVLEAGDRAIALPERLAPRLDDHERGHGGRGQAEPARLGRNELTHLVVDRCAPLVHGPTHGAQVDGVVRPRGMSRRTASTGQVGEHQSESDGELSRRPVHGRRSGVPVHKLPELHRRELGDDPIHLGPVDPSQCRRVVQDRL